MMFSCMSYTFRFYLQDLQNQMNILNPKQGMPDLSEMMTNLLGGGQPKKSTKPKAVKKRQT